MGQQDISMSTVMFSAFLGLIIHKSNAMVYHVPLNINTEDLDSLFGEDGCIEGSLSVMETGGPNIRPISFVGSERLSSVQENQNNEIGYLEKSPMSLVYELAHYNKIKMQYTLTHEKGPGHKKLFGVSLKLGEENYYGEGTSIKKAQNEAARSALNSTLHDYPPNKGIKNKIFEKKKTPVQHLDTWARKHNNAVVHYSFTEQSQIRRNYYHQDMYSLAENIHKVIVKIGNENYYGEGPLQEIAQQNAASAALKHLQSNDGFCMLEDKEKSLFSRILNFDSSNESPISIVYEFALLSKMPVSFDLHSEAGPSHIKTFVYRCVVDDKFETLGEGSSKKQAKREAAINMIKKLKIHASVYSKNCEETPKRSKTKKKKTKNLIKNTKSYPEFEENAAEYLIPEELDPVSKLFQIQQSKNDIAPVFTVLDKRSNTFFIRVKINDLTFVGSGPNKKIAKKNAAKGILEKMGYLPSIEKGFGSPNYKMKEFIEDKDPLKKATLSPGLIINSNGFSKTYKKKEFSFNEDKLTYGKNIKTYPKSVDKEKNHNAPKNNKNTDLRPKVKLANIAQQLRFKFQFSDFPKGNNSEFVSLISLTTEPPRVCYGIGLTTEISQDKAALSALNVLYKSEYNHISKILREETSEMPRKEGIVIIEKEAFITSTVTK